MKKSPNPNKVLTTYYHSPALIMTGILSLVLSLLIVALFFMPLQTITYSEGGETITGNIGCADLLFGILAHFEPKLSSLGANYNAFTTPLYADFSGCHNGLLLFFRNITPLLLTITFIIGFIPLISVFALLPDSISTLIKGKTGYYMGAVSAKTAFIVTVILNIYILALSMICNEVAKVTYPDAKVNISIYLLIALPIFLILYIVLNALANYLKVREYVPRNKKYKHNSLGGETNNSSHKMETVKTIEEKSTSNNKKEIEQVDNSKPVKDHSAEA